MANIEIQRKNRIKKTYLPFCHLFLFCFFLPQNTHLGNMESTIELIKKRVTYNLVHRLPSGCLLQYRNELQGAVFKDIAGVKQCSSSELPTRCDEASKKIVAEMFKFFRDNGLDKSKKIFYNIHVTKLALCDDLYYVKCIFSK